MTSGYFTAAMYGETTSLLESLQEVSDPAKQKLIASTALIIAAWKGHAETVRALHEWGADINFQDTTGRTALMYAARWGHEAVVKQLLNIGATKDIEDNKRMRAYDYAKHKKFASMLK